MEHKKGYFAQVRFVRISASKVRPIADKVRRQPYSEAIAVLENMPHKGAHLLRKVISSAAANALFVNKNLDEDMLYIKELQVNEGPRMKRLWARGRGRADQLLKRMSHISVVVDEIASTGAKRGTEG